MSIEGLYREVILDHYRNPRNRGTLDHPDAHAEGNNPLCGDELTLDLLGRQGAPVLSPGNEEQLFVGESLDRRGGPGMP